MYSDPEIILSELTIVIPTYNRQSYARRTINYWSKTDINLIVLDGSKLSIEESYIKKLPSNIKYIHNNSSLYSRIYSIIDMVDSEFVMLGCDDEFYTASALKNCIKQLKKNTSLVSCIGLAASFDWNKNSVIAERIYPRLKANYLNYDDSNKRILKHFSRYKQSHLYAVSKSKFWKVIAKAIFSKEFNFFAAWELQFEYLLPYAGKSLVIPELMWLRSQENQPIRGTSPSMDVNLTFSKWWITKNYKEEREIFFNHMNNVCKEIDRINKKSFSSDVKICFETFYKNDKPSLVIIMYRAFPDIIRKVIKKIFSFLKVNFSGLETNTIIIANTVKKKALESLGISLKKRGIKVEMSEIKFIEETIKSFYENKS